MLCIALYCRTVGLVLHTIAEDQKNVVGRSGIVSVLFENETAALNVTLEANLRLVFWLAYDTVV